MSDEITEIVDNIKQPSVWVRVLLVVVFAFASYLIILPLILVFSVVQALFALITGYSNANLKYFAATLDLYISQIIKFMTYVSEEKPFPFSDMPEVEDGSEEGSEGKSANKKSARSAVNASEKAAAKKSETGNAETPSAAKKKAPTKATASKSATNKSTGSEDV